MAQYFWGHPETFQAAKIKSERSLDQAANIGAGIGKVGGGLFALAQQRQANRDNVDEQTAKFEAMLGRAQKQVELESTNSPEERGMQLDPAPDGGTTHGEPTDVPSNQTVHDSPIGSTQAPDGNPLSSYGKAVMERGKVIGQSAVTGLGRFAKGVGAFLGVSPDEEMQAKRMNLARLAGGVERLKSQQAMDRAVAGTLPRYEKPAAALDYFHGDSKDPTALNVTPAASKVNEWTLREDAAKGDPIAKKILEQRQNERIAQRQAGRSNININNAKLPQTDYQAGSAQARLDASRMIEQYHGIHVDPTEIPMGIVKDMQDWQANREKPYTTEERMNDPEGTRGKRFTPRPPIEDPQYLKDKGLEWIIEGGEGGAGVDLGQTDPNIGPMLETLPPGALQGGLPPKKGKPGRPAQMGSDQKVIDQDTGISFTE